MTGLILLACLELGIREPMEFFDLTPMAQDLWLQHARHTVGGHYQNGLPMEDKAAKWAADARSRGVLG